MLRAPRVIPSSGLGRAARERARTREPVHANLKDRSRALRWLTVAAVALSAACSSGDTAYCELEPSMAHGAHADLGPKSLGISETEAENVLRATPKNARGLPLFESRPGARVALFLDFDGGTYEGSRGREQFSPADLDGNENTFNLEEQIGIVRAALEVAKSYEGFDVNVTTSDAARTRSSKWAWILITNDEGSSGWARIGAIGRPSYAKAVAGADAVFSPPSSQRGYLLTHELGHNFGLEHSGLWEGGSFVEWSDLESSRTGAWMGGRNSYFRAYEWKRLQTEDSQAWQDPVEIIGDVAGFADGGGGSTDLCPDDPNKTAPGECGCGVPEGSCGDAPAIEVVTDPVVAGSPIEVRFSGLPGNSTDWVGTYQAGTSDQSYLQYIYSDGRTSGTMTFDGLPAGDHEVRLFFDDSYDREARVSFTVIEESDPDACPDDPDKTEPGECGCGVPEGSCGSAPTIEVATDPVLAGAPIEVRFSNLPGNSTDWAGTYEAGTGDRAYLQYIYSNGRTSGTMVFDGLPAGDYEARLYLNDTYDRAARVAFTVVEDADPDACPDDPDKTEPGECGCGVPEGSCSSTTVSLSVSDAFVDSERASSNYGGAPTLEVDGSPSIKRTLIRPRALNELPSGARIESAELVLEVFDPGDDVAVHRLTQSWSEESVTYNNAPGASSPFTTFEGSTGTKVIDVTDIVQAWVDGAAALGLGLYPTGSNGVDLYSAESSTSQSRPYFRVTYTGGN